MNAQHWLQLDPVEFEDDQQQTINGVVFHISVSPYDIPSAVRGAYDEKKARFIIEFKYPSNESSRETKVDEHVTLRLGSNSNRIYAIEADIQAMEADAVLLQIDHLIDEASTNRSARPNYQVARQVIKSKAPQLWKDAIKIPMRAHAVAAG